jgi:hypothetical protein
MAPSIRCPATRTGPGNAALRLAGTPAPRGAGAWPPATTADALPTR